MRLPYLISVALLLCAGSGLRAQDAPPEEPRRETRYSLAVIDDATFYAQPSVPMPRVLNQVLMEPSFSLKYLHRWSLSTSLIGLATTYGDSPVQAANHTSTQLRVKESYGGLSAGDFDFTVGRKMVRWGTGYAFTAAGVLDPPRTPTNPTDRLNVNQGRDMVKADWVHGQHALSLVWSTAALAPAHSNLRDTTAFRYNVLLRGFDTTLIAGNDRGGDSFGALTFTRVLGQAWEVHGEATWREQAAVLMGGKYTTASGITFIGEFYTPPDIPYYRDTTMFPLTGRQHYAFIDVGKSRLREVPGWKEWDLSGYAVVNLNDRSYTAIFDANRRFGNRFSGYTHIEIPAGSKRSEYGSTPYPAATSVGVRFQL